MLRKAVRSALKDFQIEGMREVRQVQITLRTRMQEHHEVGLSRSATKNSGGVNINTPMIFLFVVSVRHVNWIASSVVFFVRAVGFNQCFERKRSCQFCPHELWSERHWQIFSS